jgi:predicted transposase YdaD
MEDMRKDAVWQEKVDAVFRLLELNLSHEQIARGTGLTVEQVKEIAGQRSA